MALVTDKFVPVPLRKDKAALTLKLVLEALRKILEVANRLVVVAFVKMPVLGVVFPIGELSTVPPEMVRAPTTIASVMELLGKATTPDTEILVEVTEVIVRFVPAPVVKFKPVVVTLVEFK